MAAEIIELALRLRDEASDKLSDLSDSLEKAEKKSVSLKPSIAGLSSAFAAVGSVLAGVAAGFFALQSAIHSPVIELDALSSRTGIAIDTLQGLQYAASGSGVNFSELESSLEMFNERVVNAANGNKDISAAFLSLGVSVTDANGALRVNDDILRDLLESIGEIEDPTKRSAVAMGALGDDAGKLLTVLGNPSSLQNFSSIAGEYGFSTGPAAVEASRLWARSVADMKLILSGFPEELANAFGGDSIEFLDAFVLMIVFLKEILLDLIIVEKEWLKTLWSIVKMDFSSAGESFGRMIDTATNSFDRAMSQAQKFANAREDLRSDSFSSATSTTSSRMAAFAPSVATQEGKEGAAEEEARYYSALSDLIASAQAIGAPIQLLNAQFLELSDVLGTGALSGDIKTLAEQVNAQIEAYQEGLEEYENWKSSVSDSISSLNSFETGVDGTLVALEEAFSNAFRAMVADQALGFLSSVTSQNPLSFLEDTGFLGALVSKIVGFLSDIGSQGLSSIEERLNNFAANTGKGLEMLPDLIIRVLPRFAAVFLSSILKAIPVLIGNLIKALGDMAANALERLPEILKEVFKMLVDSIKAIFQNIGNALNPFTDSEGNRSWLGRGIDKVKDFFSRDGSNASGGIAHVTGMYKLHAGERVLTQFNSGSQPSVNITINTLVTDHGAVPALVRLIRPYLGSYGGNGALTPLGGLT